MSRRQLVGRFGGRGGADGATPVADGGLFSLPTP